MSQDIEYYRRREQQERARSEAGDDHGARRIHQEMAERYRALVEEMTVSQPIQMAG